MSGARTVMLVLGGGAALILAFVGILNFINVMSMDITVRKMELATLESIGMEKRKVRRMLLFEGLGYAVMTLLLSATLGNGAVYGIFTPVQTPGGLRHVYLPDSTGRLSVFDDIYRLPHCSGNHLSFHCKGNAYRTVCGKRNNI